MEELNWVELHYNLCTELNRLYAIKNADYGNSFHNTWTEEGYAMARIRLSDKLNRFKTLTQKSESGQMVLDESIRDTLMDLANYALMTVLEIDFQEQQDATETHGETEMYECVKPDSEQFAEWLRTGTDPETRTGLYSCSKCGCTVNLKAALHTDFCPCCDSIMSEIVEAKEVSQP